MNVISPISEINSYILLFTCQFVKAVSNRSIEYRVQKAVVVICFLCSPTITSSCLFWGFRSFTPQPHLINTMRVAKEGLCGLKLAEPFFNICQVERKKEGGLDVPVLLVNTWNWTFNKNEKMTATSEPTREMYFDYLPFPKTVP